jgi:predicted ATPase/class 3 adenylate cyclase
MNCGTPLRAGEKESTKTTKSTNVSGLGDSRLLGQYLPPELVAKLEAARAHGAMAGERRVITMLFCDVKGSTAAAEQVDPEGWTEIMNGAFERMIAPIYRYEGTVPRLMGDAILAFFGAPIAHEDDPQRAVWAGLDIQAAMQPYAEVLRQQHGVDFGLRVGINTGLVVVGEIGSDLRMEYTALGDAVNLAARMEQTAEPGSVQITEETHKLIAPLFDFESLGGIEVKGKAEPVSAYRVLGRRASPGQLRGLEGLSSPLVGREKPLQILRDRLSALEHGNGSFVTVMGEAGLGKSSLIIEVQKEVEATGAIKAVDGNAQGVRGSESEMRWLKGDGMAHARSISYFPWRQIIRRSIGVREDDLPVEVRGKLRNGCDSVGLLAEDLAFLQAMLAVESDESLKTLEDYQGEALVDRMSEAVRRYLSGLAKSGPLGLVFDDLHWADQASLGLLLNLVDLAAEQPILFLCMLRPETDAPSWKTVQDAEARLGERFTSITLQPLGGEQVDLLLGNLLGKKSLPAKLRDLIFERADGNPFFVEELIRSLIETKQIVREHNHWRAASDDVSAKLPETLRGLLSARIDRLPEPARHVIQTASVLGRTFDVRVLERLAQVARLEEEVTRLKEAGLVEGATEEMAFRHVLLQEAAYDSILMKRRAGLHRQAGEALEELHAGRVEEFAPVLAYHFYAAHDERSLKYDLLAGNKAARLYANVEAATHYRRALQTAKRIAAEPRELAQLFTKLGGVLELSGHFDQALAAYDDMHSFAHEHGILAMELDALMAKGTIYSTPTAQRDPDLGERILMEALELSRAIGNTAIQARLNWNLMLNCLHSRRIEVAYAYGQRALELARQGEDREQLAFVLNDFGRVLVCRGDFDAALAHIREGRGLWTEMENRVMLSDNLGAEEEALYSMGRFDDSLEVGKQALKISEELDNEWGKSYHRLLMGLAQMERGDLPAAIALMRDAMEMGDRGGLIISSIAGRCDLAWCYGSSGEIDKGLELIETAMAVARSNLPEWTVMPVAMKIRLHALRGERQEAEEAAAGTELRPPPVAYPHYSMMVEMARVELARLRGDYEEMLAITEAALQEFQVIFPPGVPKLLRCRSEALNALGRGDDAQENSAR